METILVWLLVTTSHGHNNVGNVSLLAKFNSREQCEHVLNNIAGRNEVKARCIQANIIKD